MVVRTRQVMLSSTFDPTRIRLAGSIKELDKKQ